ncbi:MAG: Coenzyme F420 hydrogenase/dehydrogenase, beta subunit C-terminal domain, partial [Oscillospiraceae bacterium]|nr:Coenzyme F420 hydrogenase/dehydrogenase, beta subunit C-terminal domain [Oscillospiraceae bacterium]
SDHIRRASSSGGVFTLLAEEILQRGGVVFGAAWDENWNVHHICADSKEGLAQFRGSKYLQSEIGSTYREVKRYLDSGRPVLFSGTPCQTDGLLHFLSAGNGSSRDYPGLYTQDLICHGVPSPAVWQKYLSYRERAAGCPLDREVPPSFRRKDKSWDLFSVAMGFSDQTEYVCEFRKDPYFVAFLQNLSLRPSCYHCASKGRRKNSDITLADFWGVQQVVPELYDPLGVSLVLCNTEKGRALLKAVSANLRMQETDFARSLEHNTMAYTSVSRPKNRDKFIRMVNEQNFEAAVRRCTRVPLFRRVLARVRRLGKAVLRRTLLH